MLPALLLLMQDVSLPQQWLLGGVPVTEAAITTCPYRVVSEVSADVHSTTIFGSRPSRDKVVREMRERLGKANVTADAIIEARFSPEHATVVWGKVVTGTGKAIRFIDPACSPLKE